jgi:hypothetical protein
MRMKANKVYEAVAQRLMKADKTLSHNLTSGTLTVLCTEADKMLTVSWLNSASAFEYAAI